MSLQSATSHSATELGPQRPLGTENANVQTTALQTYKQRAGRKGAWVGTALGGGLSVPVGAGYVCSNNKAIAAQQAIACAIAKPGQIYGASLWRQAPEILAQPLARVWPASIYLTHRAEKFADLLSILYAAVFDGIPWANSRPLVTRLPSADYPRSCDPRLGRPDCPDVLSYARSALWAPYIEGFICVVTGAVLGALVGAMLWRDGVNWVAKIPVERIPEGPLDALSRAFPQFRFVQTTLVSGLKTVVAAANKEVAHRQKLQANDVAPAVDENTPLLAV